MLLLEHVAQISLKEYVTTLFVAPNFFAISVLVRRVITFIAFWIVSLHVGFGCAQCIQFHVFGFAYIDFVVAKFIDITNALHQKYGMDKVRLQEIDPEDERVVVLIQLFRESPALIVVRLRLPLAVFNRFVIFV